jgi:hypothetical protein
MRMALFADQYSPANLFETADNKSDRIARMKNFATGIRDIESKLIKAYPNAAPKATEISWPDVERCLWNKSGAPGGGNKNTYFRRNDLNLMGLKPTHPIGHKFAENSIWKTTQRPSPLPTTIDYFMNPDLFVIIMFAFLVVILAGLLWLAQKSAKNAPRISREKRDAELQKLEKTDPYKDSAFASYDPTAKCRSWIESMEQQGYSMENYRQQCGLPPAEPAQ